MDQSAGYSTKDFVEPLIVRPSELKLFRRCRRQWEIKYVHGIGNEQHEEGVANVGTLVHKSLECYYKTGFAGGVGEGPDAELAGIMVDGYLEWLDETGADDGLRVEAVEWELEVPWPTKIQGRDVVIQGHIDLLATDLYGVRKLIDHKTVQSLEQYASLLAVDSQLLTYALMLKLSGTEIGGALHNALRRVKRTSTAKPPFYQRNEVTYGLPQLRSHYAQVEAQISDMIRVRDEVEHANRASAYPSPSRDCTWDCPYMQICPSFDDGSNISGILEAMKNA